ncbi:uroporphyrinogen-III C-methyltransferase [Alteromonadaceae bacterium BrNp21-10]|nr:uroporphyrinogen-III C-methyltransferase [Alteromonadaceae bacterium BrNp21-10]
MADFLLFRPEPKCSNSVAQLQAAGIDVIGQPLQQIEADNQQIKLCQQTLSQLPAKSYVVFTSTFAVEYALESFKDTSWSTGLTCFAVGKSTADALATAGIKANLPKRFDSEGLLELAELIDVKDKQVVIVKGHNGRESLINELEERGAKVNAFNLYHRRPVALNNLQQTWQQSAIRCIIVTSGEQIDIAFKQCDQQWLLSRHWITVSQRLADHLTEKGVSQIHLSEGAHDEALITSAKHYLAQALEQATMAQDTPSAQQQKLQKLAEEVRDSVPTTPSKPTAAAKTPAAPAPKANTTASTPASIRKGSPWLALFTIINLLLLLLVFAAGYWAWQQWDLYQQSNQQRVDTEQQQMTSALTDMRSQLQNDVDQQAAVIAQQLQQFQHQDEAFNKRLAELNGQRPSDWVLAEADYLVRMAGRKLWLEHDVATAILMLQNADQRLADLNDPSLIPIRTLLTEDIQTVRLINNVSLSEIALELSALVGQVNGLPLAMVTLPEAEETAEDTALTTTVDDWRTNLAKSWNNIVDDFITVRRRTDSVQPLMSEQQQWLAKEQLKHYLLQAEIAALREQSTLFKSMLDLSQQSLNQYFDLSVSSSQQFLQQLRQLAERDIARYYPQQLAAAQPLQDLLKQRVNGLYSNSQQDLDAAPTTTGDAL